MEIAVKDAAQRLGITESRVRQLLHAGDLAGRRVGRSWLVAAEDVARLERQHRRPGRPIGPLRAWGLLDILNGGNAPWLSYSARSQVRSYMARLQDADGDEWRAVLRGRSHVIRAQAHPAALRRLQDADGVLPAGAAQAMQRGFDLVSFEEAIPEVYLQPEQWSTIAPALAIREDSPQANLLVRLPRGVWPFEGCNSVPDPAIAADLLEAPEPRAARAGAIRLDELLGSRLR